MLHNKQQFEVLDPIFGSDNEEHILPKYQLNNQTTPASIAYQLVKDELLDEGNARQNLATFCQTYMEPEAVQLMKKTLEKNAIDKSEYPRVAELESRCINIIADLWHAPKAENFLGTSTIGSSEACMLAGMAMKFAWRNRAKKLGIDTQKKKPNLIISSAYQVCWEKFAVYWDVELREIPITDEHLTLNIDQAIGAIDEYTIGVVAILGITYTGKYDDIATLNTRLNAYNQQNDHKVYIHVDAASGGLFTPFNDPKLEWDFRLNNVVSINTSGHKYGLVYPGVGWVLWRDKQFLPQELIFNVSYLGGEVPTMAINFSHSASHIIGQYYNFLRYGYEGYRKIHQNTQNTALFISQEIANITNFKVINDGAELPIICYTLIENHSFQWNLYDLSDRLRMKGWQVPTYPLPKQLENVIIQRIVVREDLGMNLAREFIEDFKDSITELNEAHLLFHQNENKSYGFTH